MATLFVRHQIADFATWKAAYDGFQPTARGMGVTRGTVYVEASDPNDITVIHDFPTLEAAQAFAGSDGLHEAMGKAGVVGAPTIWFANKL